MFCFFVFFTCKTWCHPRMPSTPDSASSTLLSVSRSSRSVPQEGRYRNITAWRTIGTPWAVTSPSPTWRPRLAIETANIARVLSNWSKGKIRKMTVMMNIVKQFGFYKPPSGLSYERHKPSGSSHNTRHTKTAHETKHRLVLLPLNFVLR